MQETLLAEDSWTCNKALTERRGLAFRLAPFSLEKSPVGLWSMKKSCWRAPTIQTCTPRCRRHTHKRHLFCRYFTLSGERKEKELEKELTSQGRRSSLPKCQARQRNTMHEIVALDQNAVWTNEATIFWARLLIHLAQDCQCEWQLAVIRDPS